MRFRNWRRLFYTEHCEGIFLYHPDGSRLNLGYRMRRQETVFAEFLGLIALIVFLVCVVLLIVGVTPWSL